MLLKWIKILSAITLVFICVLYFMKTDQINFIQDDAYITIRYVENFTEGNGLIFNNGERVEGYTNLLWVLILSFFALISKLFSHQIDLAKTSQMLSLFFGIMTLVVSYFFTIKLIKKKNEELSQRDSVIIRIIALVPPFLLMLSAPMLYWGISGMETTLFTWLTMLSIYLYIVVKNENGIDTIFLIVSLLNTLTRPEGMLVFVLIISWSPIQRLMYKRNERKPISKLLSARTKKELLYYFTPFALYVGLRLIYYGYPLPNTFYAKTGFTLEHISRGVDYVIGCFRENFILTIFLLLPLLGIRNLKLRPDIFFFYFFVFLYSSAILLIGGDVLPIDRFILPLIPIIFLFSTVSISQFYFSIKQDWKKYLYIALVFVSVGFLGVMNYESRKAEINTKRSYEVGLVKKMKIYGEWIRKQSLEKNNSRQLSDLKVALSTIGALSYSSGVTIVDLVGLTDEYTAHNPVEVPGIDEELPVLWKERRYNAGYVLSREPDYIIFPAGAKPTAFAECALYVQQDFYKNYYVQLIYSDELRQLLPIYTRRKQPLIIDGYNCNVKFVKPFIEANNLFLTLTSNRGNELMNEIISKTDEAMNLCPARSSDIDALKGYAFYHSGEIENSKLSFSRSVEKDSLNMISRFYLMKINYETGNEKEMIKQIRMIRQYSPGALPEFYDTANSYN